MNIFSDIIGAADQPGFREDLHRLDHAHAVDHLRLSRSDLARRRFRGLTDAGREVAIALPRSQQLFDGAILELKASAALVVRVETEDWLRFVARDAATALRLGYFAGNLHWRVRFEGDVLLIAVETERRVYLDRLEPMIQSGEIRPLRTAEVAVP
ncbi:urease accessory protein UreE, putative [Roseovarius sp. TM1035]|jgi:urease accessory protein|uniref:urease accessory protein UreE n=1 Tax=Roseovarius TaxID=74030 RepID=UPI0001557335|nr:urease accessory protein UreE [Roseovarius sp. TM1035]AWZ18816.1 Urease accessory protein UreE [Roseovarius sp. AK1035]EDM32464.1 urease accessory protein UreE, putative [Roseovarius sp. TM1035]|tara:strand:+ start:3681 stop:4145 length:465 start_codon:yes stop_codon:yes gene_type:complete